MDSLSAFLMENTPHGIMLLDPNACLIEANTVASTLLGLALEQHLQEHIQKFIKNPQLIQLILGEKHSPIQVRLSGKRMVKVSAHILDTQQHVILLEDITNQHHLDSRRESLVRVIAHDLRNPLSALHGYMSLVKDFGTLNADQEKYLNKAQDLSTRLHRMVNDLVNLAWIESGMPFSFTSVSFPSLIHEVVQQVRPIAQSKKITIMLSIQNDLIQIQADATRLKQALYHLLMNAIQYSENEQIVVVHTWSDADEIYCSIADRGIGIAEHEVDAVFDRLYRSQDERVLRINGNGLGLTFTREIIRRHNGEIWLTSTLGEGSQFTFSLPIHAKESSTNT
ncbi:MAG: ATP-binding protein [Phototrophicaceae bacterium]